MVSAWFWGVNLQSARSHSFRMGEAENSLLSYLDFSGDIFRSLGSEGMLHYDLVAPVSGPLARRD
jgi:hypothetical protein